jgi:hypothetical protein
MAGIGFANIVQQVQDAMWQGGVSPHPGVPRRSKIEHYYFAKK